MSILNSFDRQIVSTYIGTSCKSTEVINTLYQALKYRKTNGAGLIIRTDNGTQFISKLTSNFMETLGITQEFGYPHNPDCQAFIESFHASVQREFVALNEFTSLIDFIIKYKVYLDFYHNIRPHGSLKNMIPKKFYDCTAKTN